jgi:hypothetical protein
VTDLLTLYGVNRRADAYQPGDTDPAGQHDGLVSKYRSDWFEVTMPGQTSAPERRVSLRLKRRTC